MSMRTSPLDQPLCANSRISVGAVRACGEMPAPALARRVATRRAVVARTMLAEGGKCVVAGVVAIAPGGCYRVLANEHDVHETRLLRRQGRGRIEPTGQAGLAAA